jgi:hypothetical protein
MKFTVFANKDVQKGTTAIALLSAGNALFLTVCRAGFWCAKSTHTGYDFVAVDTLLCSAHLSRVRKINGPGSIQATADVYALLVPCGNPASGLGWT